MQRFISHPSFTRQDHNAEHLDASVNGPGKEAGKRLGKVFENAQ
jgi:hypothetical protein